MSMDKDFLEKLIASANRPIQKGARLKVDKRLSQYIEKYEKLRNIVGFHDEHVWRRYAIERIIKRLMLIGASDSPRGEALLQELVLAEYIIESDVTDTVVKKVEAVIAKYLSAQTFIGSDNSLSPARAREWLFSLMAVEIEDALGLIEHERALVDAMLRELASRLSFPKFTITKEQEHCFLLTAISRTLLKADPPLIAYFFIQEWHRTWFSMKLDKEMVEDVITLPARISSYERHALYKEVLRLVKPYSVIFLVLDEVIKKYKGDFHDFTSECGTVLHNMNAHLTRKVKRQIWYSFLYLLATKLVLVFIIELPYERLRGLPLNYTNAGINLIFPIVLLLILTLGIRVGSVANAKFILQETENILRAHQSALDGAIQIPRERSILRSFIFHSMFFTMYILTYGAIVYALYRLNFNPVSGALFIIFMTLVTYLAIRIRLTADRLLVILRFRSVGREILSFFALPILASGKWIVGKFSRYNLIIMIFDLLFEAPYKTIIFLFRDFSDYASEMRERASSS